MNKLKITFPWFWVWLYPFPMNERQYYIPVEVKKGELLNQVFQMSSSKLSSFIYNEAMKMKSIDIQKLQAFCNAGYFYLSIPRNYKPKVGFALYVNLMLPYHFGLWLTQSINKSEIQHD